MIRTSILKNTFSVGLSHPIEPLAHAPGASLLSWRNVVVGLVLFIGCGAVHAQDKCLAECKSTDGPCSGLNGKAFAQCLGQCNQKCRPPHPPPPPLLDPRCGNRTATGQFNCTIEEPVVTQHETSYPAIVFAPGDIVNVKADGCVQTGGFGDTWKRYVNPSGANAGTLYHGLIRIPTAKPAGSGLVRIESVIGKPQTVTGTGVPASQLFLHLGYEDDGYGDNGYYSHDDGNPEQCKFGGRDDGGPAHVTITICRGVTCAAPTSRFDFDVLANSVDPNGLPYNPQWSWQQRNQGQTPNTSQCHNFSTRGSTLGIPDLFLSPSFSDCTDQTDQNSVDLPLGINQRICQIGGLFSSDSFAGHLNWFPVTLEGRAGWGDHGWQDDDYTFTFNSDLDGNPLSINGRPGLHIEFDSDETIDNFKSDEWKTLRGTVDDGTKDQVKQRFDGHTILTGMFSVDGEHDMKAELHPLFALATRRDNFENDPKDDVWLMFVRNRGDEGFCSSDLWDAGFEDYTVRLPWLAGMTSVDVNWSKTQFEGTDGTSGPTVAVLAPPAAAAGVYVTFHLGPSATSPFIDGALHLTWTGQPVSIARRTTTVLGGLQPPAVVASEPADEGEQRIQVAMNKLTPAQRLEIKNARAAAVPRRAMHQLPPGGPARRITAAPRILRIGRRHAIKAGPATQKAARDAATIGALCAATNNAPSGLPADVCKGPVRDHR